MSIEKQANIETGEINQQLKLMQTLLSELDDVASSLKTRIEPVLGNDISDCKDVISDSKQTCVMASILDEYNNKIRLIIRNVVDALERIQL